LVDDARRSAPATCLRDALYLPTGRFSAKRAFDKNLDGVVDAPIPFLRSIEKVGV
jgi:hypothetical protein